MKLRIEKAIYGGAGLARADGKVIFVPYTLPGELVEAQPGQGKRGFAEAALLSVLEPAAARVQPPCPYFGVCGGCHYQHASYVDQVAMKVSILAESLGRAGLRDLPEITPVFAEPFGYRNRVRLHVDRGTSALCYKQRGSQQNLAVGECPIAVPLLERALSACPRLSLGGNFSEVELFTNHDASALLLSLWASPGTTGASALASVAEALQSTIPELRGAAVFAPKPARGRAPRRGEGPSEEDLPSGAPIAIWGAPALTYTAAGEQYRVSFGSFFQGNAFLIDILVELATGDQQGGLAWDLYAGVGLFSKVLASRFAQVVAVDGASSAASDLRVNLLGHRTVGTGTLEFLRQAGRQRPDLVLVDPPRAGLGPEITDLLSRIGPPFITYVSCDPATLSRDLAALVSSGYRIRKLHMVDLFPQTFHLETVAQLSLE